MTRPDIKKDLVARHFSRSASVYESITPIQSAMVPELLQLATNALQRPEVKHILELGCGTGRLTRMLIKKFPSARLVAVDISPEMVMQAAHKLRADRLELFVADAEEICNEGEGVYDLIISNATVQWFADPARTLKAYRQRLKPGGCLAFSTFGPDTFKELRESFGAAYAELGETLQEHILPLMPPTAYLQILPGAEVFQEHRVQPYPDVRSFLRAIQSSGAAYAPNRPQTLSRPAYERMCRYYEEHFSNEQTGEISATFHVMHVISLPSAATSEDDKSRLV